jgi:alpha-N-arabinofuranosidase
MDKQHQNLKFDIMMTLTLCTFIALMSCHILAKSDTTPDVGKSVALFDYFNYSGDDEIYTSNPLPDDESFYNPVLPGWYSDPSICYNGDGDYFLVTSTFSYFPGVPVFHSRDLVNWHQVGNALNRTSQLEKMEGQGINGGIYAASISYNKANKTYYIVTTNVGAGNFFVKTKDPFGEWSDPIYLPEVGGIDPSFLFDDDGKAYIVNNEGAPDGKPEYDGHCTIRVQEFDVANDRTVGPRKILINKGMRPEDKPIWIEGPHMYKIDGKYYLMCAEGGTGSNHSEVIARSDSPMGGFVPWTGNPILTQRTLDSSRPNPVTCTGHAELFQTKEGEWWSCFLGCRPINNQFENLGRETFLMPVRWSVDGFPYITREKELVPVILKRPGVKRDSLTTFGNFAVREEFDSGKLGPEWMTLRTPITDQYSLTETPGYLKLKCSKISSVECKSPSYVCRRVQHHRFVAETSMLFNPTDSTEYAGLMLFKDDSHQYFLSVGRENGERRVMLWQIGGASDYQIASQPIGESPARVELKIVSSGSGFDFYYSVGKGGWKQVGRNIDALYLSTAFAGGFTGTTVGMYATSKLR